MAKLQIKDSRLATDARQISATELRNLLIYDANTGIFRWRHDHGKMKSGKVAGTVGHYGYIQICLHYVIYKAHRLAWLYVHGRMPKWQLDHINRDRTDNRISNLREATPSQNGQNRIMAQSNSRSGILGVVRDGHAWYAYITINGKAKNLGRYDSAAEARAAYLSAKKRLHPYFTGD